MATKKPYIDPLFEGGIITGPQAAGIPTVPKRPVSADGLTYTDAQGGPTPEYFRRQQALDASANLTTQARAGTVNPGASAGHISPEEWERIKPEDGGFWADMGRFAGAGAGILANPVGGVLGPYLPEKAEAAINPVGYVSQAGIDEALDRYVPGGSGLHGNNIIPGVAGTGGDVMRPSETAGGIGGMGGLGDVFSDPAAGLNQYAQRSTALGAGARDALRPVTAQRDAQARDMYAQGAAAQNRTAAQTGAVNYGAAQQVGTTSARNVNYGPAQTIASTPGASAGDFGAQQSINAPTLAAAQQAAMGNFGSQQSVNAARVGAAQQAVAQQAQATQAQNQAGFLAGTAQGARDLADLDFAQANESRQAMGDSLNRIRSYVDQGPGESQAQAQLRMAQEQSLGDALSLARSGRGNAAGNMKMALSENAATNAQTNMQASLLRANEADLWRGRQLQGLGLEQQGTTAMRGQDITAATAQGQHALGREQIASNVDVSRAGLEQGLAQFNAGALNQASLTNAQLGTQTSIANAEQSNLGTRLQAQLSTDAAIQQASLANARNIAMGNAGTQVSMGNAEQANLTSRLQGQLQSDAAINQANLANARNIAMGNAGTQVSMSNADRLGANARAQAELANQLAIAQGNSTTQIGTTNANNASAAQRAQAELANQLAIAQGNSTTTINQANLDAQVRQREANDLMQREMYGYGIDSQQMGQDALTYGLGLERDYSGQANQLAAEIAKARAIRQAALIGGGASIIEELIPG